MGLDHGTPGLRSFSQASRPWDTTTARPTSRPGPRWRRPGPRARRRVRCRLRSPWPYGLAAMSPSGELDVVAIGSAIVDVLASCEDDFVERHGLVKGTMALIDEEQSERLYAE